MDPTLKGNFEDGDSRLCDQDGGRVVDATAAQRVGHRVSQRRELPARVECWSERHRDEQVRYANLYVIPTIGTIPCARLTRISAGLIEGHLLARQDLLRGLR